MWVNAAVLLSVLWSTTVFAAPLERSDSNLTPLLARRAPAAGPDNLSAISHDLKPADHSLFPRQGYLVQKRVLGTFYRVLSAAGATVFRVCMVGDDKVKVPTDSLIRLFDEANRLATHNELPFGAVSKSWGITFTDTVGEWQLKLLFDPGHNVYLADIASFCTWMSGAVTDLPQTGNYFSRTYLPAGTLTDALGNEIGKFILAAPSNAVRG